MGKETAIGWTHHTFNPWRGCSHAVGPNGETHPGCINCYAEFLVCEKFRMGGVKGEWGPGAPRTVAAESAWKDPPRWARAAAEAGERRRVFFSLGDPLDEEAPKEAQERFWQLIRNGAQGFWRVPGDVTAQVLAQLETEERAA
jgi:protein gp37